MIASLWVTFDGSLTIACARPLRCCSATMPAREDLGDGSYEEEEDAQALGI
jgi:hypothetical protein